MSFLFNCINFKFIYSTDSNKKIDFINELFPFPRAPHNKALFVKFPNAKFIVFSKIIFFCLSTPTIRFKLMELILFIDLKFFSLGIPNKKHYFYLNDFY